jgi:methylthioribulose-1-phosphate dehydratase
MFLGHNLQLAEQLLETIRFFHLNGWSPATSTNYSVRSARSNEFIMSRSGVDKSKFTLNDFILINELGEILPPFNHPEVKPSAETDIHITLYQKFPEIQCVLHTHSVLGTMLSHSLVKERELIFEGLEILKGLEGNLTHELREILPIVPNSQNMKDILQHLEGRLEKSHGFLIAGHGLYTWGKSVAATKRHVETFEFLFECYSMMRRY